MSVLMKAKSVLEKLQYDYNDDAVETIHDTWMSSKQNIIDHFRNHPDWDEENMAIIFSKDYERRINVDGIERFKSWGRNILDKRMYDNAIFDYKGRDIMFYSSLKNQIFNINNDINNLTDRLNLIYDSFQNVEINGIDARDFLGHLEDEYHDFRQFSSDLIFTGKCYVYKKYKDERDDFTLIMEKVKNASTSLVDEELYNFIMNRIDVQIAVGQKISKAVQKVCKYYGLDKVVEMREVTHNGITRMKDYGYNYEYALFSDSINTIKIKRHTLVSVNMVDYWLMSNGHKWSSCHNIDKKHILNDNADYSGCYSSGTESYMLDESSVIFYTVDESYDGDDFYLQDKMQRCVFSIAEDGSILLQSRVYPDGRDGGDQSLAGQFREVMQKIVADCWHINNQWTLKKGTSNCSEVTVSYGTHYRDYLQYEDCNVSFNKEIYFNQSLCIGHNPICPCCGDSHEYEESILCEECVEGNAPRCARCGGRIDLDDSYVYCDDNGCYYCDSECAERDDVYYCENDGFYHDLEHCFYDDWEGEYYHGEPSVITYDGTRYRSEENALNDGYDYCDDDGEWYQSHKLATDEYTGHRFLKGDHDYVYIESEDVYYIDSDNARNDGWIETDEGWMRIEDVA